MEEEEANVPRREIKVMIYSALHVFLFGRKAQTFESEIEEELYYIRRFLFPTTVDTLVAFGLMLTDTPFFAGRRVFKASEQLVRHGGGSQEEVICELHALKEVAEETGARFDIAISYIGAILGSSATLTSTSTFMYLFATNRISQILGVCSIFFFLSLSTFLSVLLITSIKQKTRLTIAISELEFTYKIAMHDQLKRKEVNLLYRLRDRFLQNSYAHIRTRIIFRAIVWRFGVFAILFGALLNVSALSVDVVDRILHKPVNPLWDV